MLIKSPATNFGVKLTRPGFGPAAELPTSSRRARSPPVLPDGRRELHTELPVVSWQPLLSCFVCFPGWSSAIRARGRGEIGNKSDRVDAAAAESALWLATESGGKKPAAHSITRGAERFESSRMHR